MVSLRPVLLCLAPALVAYLAILLAGERLSGFAIMLIMTGSGIAASYLVSRLHRTMEPKGQMTMGKGIIESLAFLGTLAGYLAFAAGGCVWISKARF